MKYYPVEAALEIYRRASVIPVTSSEIMHLAKAYLLATERIAELEGLLAAKQVPPVPDASVV